MTIRSSREIHANAFTLVEILVTMAILAFIAGFSLIAASGARTTAREARTRAIIASVDSVLQEKYDALRYRAFAVEIPNLFNSLGADEVGFEVLASERARVRLQMLRDWMRIELPDRFSDLFEFRDSMNNMTFVSNDVTQIASQTFGLQISLQAAANPVRINASGVITGTRTDPASRSSFPAAWGGIESAVQRAYRSRLTGRMNLSTTAEWDALFENQSAECLHLILSSTFVGGTSAIDAIPTQNIGDKDADGLPEILDGWGQPLGFIRWPIGYQDPQEFIVTSEADDFDLYNSDFTYGLPTATVFSATSPRLAVDVHTGSSVNPWAMRPLVISAGADGEFGIALNARNDSDQELGAFQYHSSTFNWPVDIEHMGNEFQGRTMTTYPAVDPYLRLFLKNNDPGIVNRSNAASYTTSRRLPGEDVLAPTATLRFDPRKDDNITNYALQGTQ